jgi:hypothetical protein
MRSPRIVVALAVAAVGAGSWWALSSEEPATSPVLAAPEIPRATSGNTAEVERELKALRAEMESLRRQQANLSKTVDSVGGVATEAALKAEAAAPAPAPPTAAEREAAMAQMEARRQARAEELFGQLEEASYTEARDPVWAGRTEALISEAVRSVGADSQLTRAECRSNLCRVELQHAGVEARTKAVDGLLATPGLKGEFVVRRLQEGDRLVSLVYVAREGTRLPPFRK